MALELIVCDVAGTALQEHGAVYEALREAVSAAGPAVQPDAVKHWMGSDKRAAIRGLLGDEAPDDELVDTVHADFRARLQAKYERRPPAPFAGVPELFASLRERGVRVALTTGFDREIAGPLLESVGWDGDLIDAVVTADEVLSGRPAPYMIFRAMERCGVQRADRVLTAGDTVLDLRAGCNAGAAAVVGVLSGGVDAAVLGAERHTHILPELGALETILPQLR